MAKRKKLNPLERDILDGFERPSLRPDRHGIPSLEELQDDYKQSSTVEGSITPDDLVSAIRSLVKDQEQPDASTGGRASPRPHLPDEVLERDVEILIERVEKKSDRLIVKAQRLKEAVDKRQEAVPTVVTFNPKDEPLLKRGLMRVWKHSDNTITYEMYKAALGARKELSKRFKERQLKDAEGLI